MSEALQHRAERLKLARLLSIDVEALPPLDEVPAHDLARLRAQMTDRLFDEGARALGRAGAAARLVPSPVIATIAQRAFGPLLAARAAGAIDPAKAVDVARRLEPDFLADVTVELDPRRVSAMLAEVPRPLAVAVAAELSRRGEHVTMGRFLAYVPEGPLAGAMDVLDDEALLRTAFVLEAKDRLDDAVALLPPERVPGLLTCAAEQDLWPEALDLLAHLSPARLGPVADALATLDDDVVAAMVAAVADADLWATLLPVVGEASPATCTRLAAAPAFHDEEVLAAIVRTAAAGHGWWVDLVPLVDALPAPARATVARAAAALDPRDLRRVVDQALEAPQTLSSLVRLYLLMDATGREAVRTAASRGRRSALAAALDDATGTSTDES